MNLATSRENLEDLILGSYDDLDEVVVDKPAIKIRGIAKIEKKKAKAQEDSLKQAITMYLHSKKRIRLHEQIRKTKLEEVIIPTIKQELEIIKRKHNTQHAYAEKKEKYVKQFFNHPQEARAFIKKHLQHF